MRNSRTLARSGSFALALLAAAVLTACGGGGGDDAGGSQAKAATPNTTTATPGTSSPSSPAGPVTTTSLVTPACSGCGTVDATTYAGSGVGVWQTINASAAAIDVPVSIAGVNGQDVTLVFTNQTAVPQPMPSISLTASYYWSVAESQLRWASDAELDKTRIGEFNREGWTGLANKGAAPNRSLIGGPSRSVVNDIKTWYHSDNSARTATLVRQRTASDGTTINFWVENAENDPTKVSSTILDALDAGFVSAGKIYDMLKSVGGPMWGTHSYSNLISPTGQPIDIVVLNFDHNNTPFGMVGYFFARNALVRDASNPYSNESVSLYLDSETLYKGGAAGLKAMLMTMAHEGMHMQNFYRRGVVGGPAYQFDTWLEEATAMMMEDFASHAIDPTYNNVRDVRFPDFVRYAGGSYNCSLLDWTPFGASCDSYAVSGSLGGYLDRQLGLGFYKNLLANLTTTDSVAALDAAIKTVAPSSSFTDQLRRFTVTASSLMPAAASPTGFGFPARVDGGFSLPVIDPPTLAPYRTLTQAVPATLQPYASLPVVRKAIKGTYTETVKVPAGTTLSIVIQ
ncbi:M30 family zinc metallopeptidase [Cupriavidus sp. TMH.W2]|uniref:M30 family zinc metallopeptidase n=1 Tax=Cupriavidus sp. TMH.W2 TaxID=3434465 RepID=UPI003D787465